MEVVYKMCVLENKANDLAHSVTEVICKMSILENRANDLTCSV